jgi:hypothetical protein
MLYTHDLGFAGPDAARRSVQVAVHSVVVGHNHQAGLHIESDIRGKPRIGLSFGWLGDPYKADYEHEVKAMTKWNHGFGIGYMADDGVTWWTHIPIVRNTCVVEGTKFSV